MELLHHQLQRVGRRYLRHQFGGNRLGMLAPTSWNRRKTRTTARCSGTSRSQSRPPYIELQQLAQRLTQSISGRIEESKPLRHRWMCE
jgi:hypothetical protein